jgi:tetratricopeptide (TPR) repeat protein
MASLYEKVVRSDDHGSPLILGGPFSTSTPPKAVTLLQTTVWGGTLFSGGFLVLLFLASVLIGFAQPVDDHIQGSPALVQGSPAPSQRELLDEAVALRRVGAFDAAQDFLQRAVERDGNVSAQVAYQQGVLAEVTERWPYAIAAYERVESLWPGSEAAADARFRRAYCLEELGQHRAAIKVVVALQRDGAWSEVDQRSMLLQRGITEVRLGRKRVGIKRILAALGSGEDDKTWIRAKARLALVRVQLEKAARIRLKGNAKAAKRLKKRAALIGAAERQAVVMFGLSEPEFALEGLLMLGDAYLKLFEDMIAYPPPRSVDAGQRDAYQAAVLAKAAILRTKAHARYEEGVRVAVRTQWVGGVTGRLKTSRDAVAAQLAASIPR